MLRRYRILIIGGGVLLSTPHFPLYVETWVRGLLSIGLPYVIVGVGASREEILDPERSAAYRSLVGNALFVSGRDRESIEALRLFREDSCFVLDPYFSAKFSREHNTILSKDRIRAVLVPKFPLNAAERAALDYLLKVQRHCASAEVECEVIFFEPELDKDIIDKFPHGRSVAGVDEFVGRLTENTIVFSMRYHGIIFSLCNRTTCWALGARKNINLYEEIGLNDYLIAEGAGSEIDFGVFTDSHWQKVDSYHESGQPGLEALKHALTSYIP
jgi:polysaccharide pyruvyl transferase WcaK-like protein